jgi:hypothetical protein
MGQEVPNPIRLHCGYDVGVMNLFAADTDLLQKAQEFPRHAGTIFGYMKVLFEETNAFDER